MTESEWFAAVEPGPLLDQLADTASERQLRLFACACVRSVGGIPWEVCEAAKYVEKYCDGLLRWEETRSRVWKKSFQARDIVVGTSVYEFEFPPLCGLALQTARDVVEWCAVVVPRYNLRADTRQFASALRDIAGNPFRSPAFNLMWKTSTVLALSRQAYEAQDFAAMPILADALQDAGCANDDVLSHCRGDGPHVRGCWVIDLILGKG
jgi:hypothetical protein